MYVSIRQTKLMVLVDIMQHGSNLHWASNKYSAIRFYDVIHHTQCSIGQHHIESELILVRE
jgi:hypothetical protein